MNQLSLLQLIVTYSLPLLSSSSSSPSSPSNIPPPPPPPGEVGQNCLLWGSLFTKGIWLQINRLLHLYTINQAFDIKSSRPSINVWTITSWILCLLVKVQLNRQPLSHSFSHSHTLSLSHSDSPLSHSHFSINPDWFYITCQHWWAAKSSFLVRSGGGSLHNPLCGVSVTGAASLVAECGTNILFKKHQNSLF